MEYTDRGGLPCDLFYTSMQPLCFPGVRGPKEDLSRTQRGGSEEAKRRSIKFITLVSSFHHSCFSKSVTKKQVFSRRKYYSSQVFEELVTEEVQYRHIFEEMG